MPVVRVNAHALWAVRCKCGGSRVYLEDLVTNCPRCGETRRPLVQPAESDPDHVTLTDKERE